MADLKLTVSPQVAASELLLIAEASTRLGVDANRVKGVRVLRRSIDARQRQIKVNLELRVAIDTDPEPPQRVTVDYRPLPADAREAIVVGAGPAGLFAALRLIEEGIRPIVLERGKDVDSRRLDTAAISRHGRVNPDSNYCFGEGGAGAFSDGKLYTRSKKRGDVDKILRLLYQHGADESVMVDTHPHIGSDRLPGVIKAIRLTIEECGGRVMFNTRVERLLLDDKGRVTGVETAAGERFDGPVILATGHSARDTYRSLHASGIALENKGIAIGVRLEHPQELIDRIRYHSPNGRGKWLPAADYTMLTRIDDRAVYSFCMCPGGVIIPATNDDNLLVVNGMSDSGRNSRWANSGMVVEVLPEDIPLEFKGEGPLAMMAYQESIERRFHNATGSQEAPAQAMTDFVNQRPSKRLAQSSYTAGLKAARVDTLLPEPISRRLREGFKEFGKRNRGFLTSDATVIGCETRTSAPVRLPRDPQTLSHINHPGLYPCGEGAGYAGGIVSAAVDGDLCAARLAQSLENE